VNLFLDWIRDNHHQIDVLVNNAGIIYRHNPDPELKKMVMATNLLNTIALTEKIQPYLASDAKVLVEY
jgi:short-subunit dehydrogenase involved in D-alanine esterification of teichoic acids